MSQSDSEIVDGEPVYDIVPYTGEAIQLRDMTLEQLGLLLEDAREFEYDRFRSFKRSVQDEILRRMDARASWTEHLEGGVKVSGDSPDRHEWDVDALRRALHAIVEEGLLPAETASKAMKAEVSYKPVASGLNALLKLGGEVRDRIEACRMESSRPRAVRVSRS